VSGANETKDTPTLAFLVCSVFAALLQACSIFWTQRLMGMRSKLPSSVVFVCPSNTPLLYPASLQYLPGAVHSNVKGGQQVDFVGLTARTMHPHGAYAYV